MKKLKLALAYIIVLFASPKQAAEAVNEAGSVGEMDERMMGL